MRIVIDLQGAQSESRFRGIGRYSLSLATAIAKNANTHEVWLALNAAFPQTILDIRRMFDGVLPQKRIRVFTVPSPVAQFDPSNLWRARAAEKIREQFLSKMNADVIHVSSLFEGWVDDAVTSLGNFAWGMNTTVTLYDLIPLVHQETYLYDKTQREYYFRKLQSLRNAKLLLAISEFSRREAIDTLGLSEECVVNVSAAFESTFRPNMLSEDRIRRLRSQYGIQRKLVMYVPGGLDARKNVDALIRAYALLPSHLRGQHQLVLVSNPSDDDDQRLQEFRRQAQLAEDELVITGYVSDDDLVDLYNLTTLFVFPSRHEGFGLPALEAMACGTPTIGSVATSIAEVIGLPDALFDPASIESIADKMAEVLKNDALRSHLRDHGLRQAKKFSWDTTAKRAIAAFEALHYKNKTEKTIIEKSFRRPKLAYVSPLPPERSGISDYSADLLPDLSRHYDIDVIVAQGEISDAWTNANCPVRSVAWFQQNVSRYERILYHFGNSPYHSHMFALLSRYAGVVVLHDFFLSNVLAYEELTGAMPGAWTNALYYSHGYGSLIDRWMENGFTDARERYPCNLEVLQNARGVVVHSQYAKNLMQHWYGHIPDKCTVVAALSTSRIAKNRSAARKALGINEDSFVVCSFGFVDPTKCSDRLIEAWCASRLGRDDKCALVLVGENHSGEYGQRLLEMISFTNRIRITGWTDAETYSNYLVAGDVSVQLRTLSRGETSRALLDCMNYGLATIVNAHGSAAEFASDAVWMLPDRFTNSELVNALETLWLDSEQRMRLSSHAREVIRTQHNPSLCAERYAQAIEMMYRLAASDRHSLVEAITALDDCPADDVSLEIVAKSIAGSSPPKPLMRQLMIDVSSIVRNDLKTGIERVVGAQLLELIRHPPEGFRIEPVYISNHGGEWHYRYARSYTCDKIGVPNVYSSDAPIDTGPEDILYVADYCPDAVIEAAKSNMYLRMTATGISINVLVYDLLPVLRPEFFPEGTRVTHEDWLKTITESASRLICISKAVADELKLWLARFPSLRKDSPMIDAIPLGADIAASVPSSGLSSECVEVLPSIDSGTTFLMVGTVEPRKGYIQTLAAFDRLWSDGVDVNLVIVGREGWIHLPHDQRRTIPEIVDRLRRHPELGKRLYWLEGISDDLLLRLYAQADALLMASEGEGFGLPIVEAAQFGLPLLARDLPVFRELASDNAYYFSGGDPASLADSVKHWLLLKQTGTVPQSKNISWLSWKQNVERLIAVLLDSSSS